MWRDLASFALAHVQNNGLNATTEGILRCIRVPPARSRYRAAQSFGPIAAWGADGPGFRAVSGLAGETAVNLNFVCKFDKIPRRRAGQFQRWISALVKGLRSIFRDCELLSRSFPRANILYRYRLHDGEDRLKGAVDRNGASTGAFAMSRTSATIGG